MGKTVEGNEKLVVKWKNVFDEILHLKDSEWGYRDIHENRLTKTYSCMTIFPDFIVNILA